MITQLLALMISWGINGSVNKLWNKFCFAEIKTESNLDFKLRNDAYISLRVKADEGILLWYIEMSQDLETNFQSIADVIKDGIVEDESGQSYLIQFVFLDDFSILLKSVKHNILDRFYQHTFSAFFVQTGW
jgi:hypothetical protein